MAVDAGWTARMHRTLVRVGGALRDAGVPFAFTGGSAVYALGGPVSEHDVDLLVRPADAERAARALVTAGMRAARTQEDWLRKVYDGDVLVDLIHRPAGLTVTDEMLAGDLTEYGAADEGKVVAEELADIGVPVVAVLGNHDYHSDAAEQVAAALTDRGIRLLDGDATTVDVRGQRLGVAGTSGFGGGFRGRSGHAFGEPEMKAFIEHTERTADRLRAGLHAARDADVLVALTHYSPVADTLRGEPPEIHPFLGAFQLGDAVDGARGGTGADLAVHGHAHAGTERGRTPGGVPVRNVAEPVIRSPYAVYRVPEPRAG